MLEKLYKKSEVWFGVSFKMEWLAAAVYFVAMIITSIVEEMQIENNRGGNSD